MLDVTLASPSKRYQFAMIMYLSANAGINDIDEKHSNASAAKPCGSWQ